MNIKDINYLDYGNAKLGTIVLMHGWGQNIEMMDMLGRPFMDNFRIINIDLPGFGGTPEPPEAWAISDYAQMINKLLKEINVQNPILIGHSFGGRIAIYYAAVYGADKVVLLSAPFRPAKAKVSIKVKIYKFVKKISFLKPLAKYLRNKWGSTDYKNASDINRVTLIKTVNEDLTDKAKEIKAPVLLIYGKDDKDVLIEEAKELEKIIPDCGLVEFAGAHHYAYLEKLSDTLAILNNFFDIERG